MNLQLAELSERLTALLENFNVISIHLQNKLAALMWLQPLSVFLYSTWGLHSNKIKINKYPQAKHIYITHHT